MGHMPKHQGVQAFAVVALVASTTATADPMPQRFLLFPALLDTDPMLLELNALLPVSSQLESFCESHLLERSRCAVLQESIDQVVDLQRFCKQGLASELPAFVMVKNIASRSTALPTHFRWMSDSSLNIATDLCNFYESTRPNQHEKTAFNCVPELLQAFDKSFAWIKGLVPCASLQSPAAGVEKLDHHTLTSSSEPELLRTEELDVPAEAPTESIESQIEPEVPSSTDQSETMTTSLEPVLEPVVEPVLESIQTQDQVVDSSTDLSENVTPSDEIQVQTEVVQAEIQASDILTDLSENEVLPEEIQAGPIDQESDGLMQVEELQVEPFETEAHDPNSVMGSRENIVPIEAATQEVGDSMDRIGELPTESIEVEIRESGNSMKSPRGESSMKAIQAEVEESASSMDLNEAKSVDAETQELDGSSDLTGIEAETNESDGSTGLNEAKSVDAETQELDGSSDLTGIEAETNKSDGSTGLNEVKSVDAETQELDGSSDLTGIEAETNESDDEETQESEGSTEESVQKSDNSTDTNVAEAVQAKTQESDDFTDLWDEESIEGEAQESGDSTDLNEAESVEAGIQEPNSWDEKVFSPEQLPVRSIEGETQESESTMDHQSDHPVRDDVPSAESIDVEESITVNELAVLHEQEELVEVSEEIGAQQTDVCVPGGRMEQPGLTENLAFALVGLTSDFSLAWINTQDFLHDKLRQALSLLEKPFGGLQLVFSVRNAMLALVVLFVLYLVVDLTLLGVSCFQQTRLWNLEHSFRRWISPEDETKVVRAVRLLQRQWRRRRRSPHSSTALENAQPDAAVNTASTTEYDDSTTTTAQPNEPSQPVVVHPMSYSSRQLIHGLPSLTRSLYQHRIAFHKLAMTYFRQMTSLAFRNWKGKITMIPKRIVESCNLNGLVDMHKKHPMSFACVAMALTLGNNSSHYLKITQKALAGQNPDDRKSVQRVLAKLTQKTCASKPTGSTQDTTEAAARKIQRFWLRVRQRQKRHEDQDVMKPEAMSSSALRRMRLKRKRTNRSSRQPRRVSAA